MSAIWNPKKPVRRAQWDVTVSYRDHGETFSETVTVWADDDIDAEHMAVEQVCGVEQVMEVAVVKK